MIFDLVLVALLAGAFLFWREKQRHPGRYSETRMLKPALLLGGIGFAAGFFGPMLLAPGANQGPMLGIFITGPVGFIAGLAWGAVGEWRRGRAAGD